MITLGTGPLTERSERDLGLAGEHDYTVVAIKDLGEKKRLLIKNPWLRAHGFIDYHNVSEDLSDVNSEHGSTTDSMTWVTARSAGSIDTKLDEIASATRKHDMPPSSTTTFWMDISDVMQNFESIYLNWNPALFKHRQDIHFNWNLSWVSGVGRSGIGSFATNPQFAIKSSKKDNVWVVLSKHFSDSISRRTERGSPAFISLYAFDNGGYRCFLNKGPLKKTPYVDSPQTLLTMEMDQDLTHTIVISEQELQDLQHSFTISTFSRSPFTIQQAVPKYLHQSFVRSSWNLATAGGNADSERYSQNPQFSVTVTKPSVICVILESSIEELRLHAKLLHGQGQRVFTVTNRDIIIDTGQYRRGCAIAESQTAVAPGIYTIICSTFKKDQLGEFTLRVYSHVKTTLTAISRQGAGRIRQKLADASFPAGVRTITAPVFPQRLAAISFTARHIPSVTQMDNLDRNPSVNSPLRLTLDLGRGPMRQILIASEGGAHSHNMNGIRTEEVTVQPEQIKRHDMWVVLDRMAGFDGMMRAEERVAVDMFTDAEKAVDVGVWRAVE